MKRKIALLLTGIMLLSMAASISYADDNYEGQKQKKPVTASVSQKKFVSSKISEASSNSKTKSFYSDVDKCDLINNTSLKALADARHHISRRTNSLKGIDIDRLSKKVKARHRTETDEEGYIEVYKPVPGYTAYPGEQLEVDFVAYDTWENYYTAPLTIIWDKNDEIVDEGEWPTVIRDSSSHYNDTFSLSGYAEGTYEISFWNIPCDSNGEYVENWADFDIPSVYITFTVESSGGSSSDTEDYLEIYEPMSRYIAYSGEKLPVDFYVYDTWSEYYTLPVTTISDEDGDIIATDEWDIADIDCWSHYVDSILLKNFSPGRYTFMVWNMPSYSNGEWAEDWDEFDIPTSSVSFLVRTLEKPKVTSLKVGKKKVTVSFSAVTGATKYQIYRSNSKSSGYKKIATTSSRKYVDKKAKKGKRYYYKVRAVRSKHGTIYSKYSTPKRSKKVK